MPISLSFMFILYDVSKFTPRQLGDAGEWFVRLLFKDGFGWSVQDGRPLRSDLRVVDPVTGRTYLVEVKTSRCGTNGLYQFNLYRRVVDRVCTDVCHSDLVILLAYPRVGEPAIFLVPVADVVGIQKIAFRDPDNAGKWAKYRRDYGVFAGVS